MPGNRVNPGDLSERITFQSPTRTADGAGGHTQSWGNISTTPTVWARVTPLSGSLALQAMQLDMKKTYEIAIRSRSDLDTKMRILWGSIIMRLVDYPKKLQGEMYMILTAEAVD
ncbi:MAG: phage head closure protein [Alphaproteobacteria bacterium]